MYKNIKKITMLLFVAATMFSFASCNKDDVNNGGSGSSSSIDESKLIGTWHFENASNDKITPEAIKAAEVLLN